MKTIKPIIFALVCAFLLIGCQSEIQTKSPTETIKALSEASAKKDAAAIKSYLSKGTLDMLDASAKRQGKPVDELLSQDEGAPIRNIKEFQNEQIMGNTATVDVKNNGTGNFEKIPLVTENGVWKVAFDKYMQDVMKRLNEDMNKPPANAQVPANVQSSANIQTPANENKAEDDDID